MVMRILYCIIFALMLTGCASSTKEEKVDEYAEKRDPQYNGFVKSGGFGNRRLTPFEMEKKRKISREFKNFEEDDELFSDSRGRTRMNGAPTHVANRNYFVNEKGEGTDQNQINKSEEMNQMYNSERNDVVGVNDDSGNESMNNERNNDSNDNANNMVSSRTSSGKTLVNMDQYLK